MRKPIRILIVSKGHDFDHDAFLAMFEAMENIQATLVQQPAAQIVLQPANIGAYDVVFFYDMCGIPDIGMQHDNADASGQPSPDYANSIEALIQLIDVPRFIQIQTATTRLQTIESRKSTTTDLVATSNSGKQYGKPGCCCCVCVRYQRGYQSQRE